MDFNNGLLKAPESPVVPLSTLWAIKYDFDGEEIQYGPDDRALPKVRPSPHQGTLARLAAEFEQGASQVGDGPPMLEAVNALTDPHSVSDVIAIPTIAAANTSENASEVEPDLAEDLASSGET